MTSLRYCYVILSPRIDLKHKKAVAGPKIVSAKIKVTIKVHKVSGRMRIRLSRDPSPYWYASFVEQPKLDIKISTDFKRKSLKTKRSLFKKLT